jgi:hypothetical protein
MQKYELISASIISPFYTVPYSKQLQREKMNAKKKIQ